jgi:hypothetical protein
LFERDHKSIFRKKAPHQHQLSNRGNHTMTTQPSLRRLRDIHEGETAARRIAHTRLDLGVSAAESCKTCPRPVWFTAFFDGTGNNYAQDGRGNRDAPSTKYSNVAKLWQFAGYPADEAPADGGFPRAISRYIEGVGTPCPKIGDSGDGLDKAFGMAAARKGELRIQWMLDELKQHVTRHMPFVNQINIAVFGFSRGATQARAFVRMLADTLAYQQGEELIWREAGLRQKQPKVVVYFLGLFDTVSSTGFGGSRLEKATPALVSVAGSVLMPGPIGTVVGSAAGGTLHQIDKGGHAEWAKDLRIPRYVARCVHYIAAHEVREKFPSDSVREDTVIPANCVEQFYPGMHSDVGGGYAWVSQEGRTNELSRVPLNNMFIEAWKAGVPLKPPSDVMASARELFEITPDLEAAWNAYMGVGESASAGAPPSSQRLETQVIWHMNRYYHWRAGRRRRLRDGRLAPPSGIDPYMKITDEEWSKDIVSVAESRTGWLRNNVHAHEEAMFEAYTGKWLASLSPSLRRDFDRFFDRYVHDSIAGFKLQMKEASVALFHTEMSRWSRNRQYFMGKRGEDFLYWRYEGWTPEYSGTKTASVEKSQLPQELDVALQVA